MNSQTLLKVKSDKEKEKIKKWISTGDIKIEFLTREELINSLSSSKQILNQTLDFLKNKVADSYIFNYKVEMIKAYNEKISGLIDYYNQAKVYNNIMFIDNKIHFSIPRYVKGINIDISNINYNLPFDIKAVFTKDNLETYEEYIIPYNFNGIYQEYFAGDKEKTLFKVSEHNLLYFYSCSYNSKGLTVGTILNYKLDVDYFIDKEGHLVLDRKRIGTNQLLLKYIPAYDGYDIKIDSKISDVELIIENDFLNSLEKSKKKIILL